MGGKNGKKKDAEREAPAPKASTEVAASDKPFDGAITRFFEQEAPPEIRAAVKSAAKGEILDPAYPWREEMKKKEYEAELEPLQVELVKMQAWAKSAGARICLVFEGRDGAGKGGAIGAVSQHLNPRGASIAALAKPTEREAGQWYFQRYVAHLPTKGEITLFDRSWYNRGVVEPVMGFCAPEQTEAFLRAAPDFERMLTDDGMHLFKFWLTMSRAAQLQRFLERESDPLKQWKLSPVDVGGLAKWDETTKAAEEMLRRTHRPNAPWLVVNSEDQRRGRLAVIRALLKAIPYDRKDEAIVGELDSRLIGPPAA